MRSPSSPLNPPHPHLSGLSLHLLCREGQLFLSNSHWFFRPDASPAEAAGHTAPRLSSCLSRLLGWPGFILPQASTPAEVAGHLLPDSPCTCLAGKSSSSSLSSPCTMLGREGKFFIVSKAEGLYHCSPWRGLDFPPDLPSARVARHQSSLSFLTCGGSRTSSS